MSDPYDQRAVHDALQGLDGWAGTPEALTKTYEFESFAAAMSFLQRAAGPVDEMNHHPEWTNVYSRVDVRLTSHDAGGVTDADVRLAGLLDDLARA